MPLTLRFGIESLDRLIGGTSPVAGKPSAFGMNISGSPEMRQRQTTSLCLIGPDGTGKSVLALHLAAQYFTDCYLEHPADTPPPEFPKVLYISTDLTHSMAETIWDNFDLRHPLTRQEPFTQRGGGASPGGLCLGLKAKLPNDMDEVLAGPCTETQVYFVDLAQSTAGDDWGFVHRLLSTLDRPPDGSPRHLVMLDAVEGFETLVGDLNAFGEKSTRRSRIAQVMRLAARKCHLLFVVEEAGAERLPEEFVTDAVVRLRNIEISGYVRRTVEIEKTRGQAHVRGQHPFVTRNGSGSTTGDANSINHDDPQVSKVGACARHPPAHAAETQSYFYVFPSINFLSRKVMDFQGKPRMAAPHNKYAGFGIPYLDTMLGGEEDEQLPGPSGFDGADRRGLPCSSVTALIGDALTQKSQLGRAFLSRAFYPFAAALAGRVMDSCPSAGRKDTTEFEACLDNAFEELYDSPLRPGSDRPFADDYPRFVPDDIRDPHALLARLRGWETVEGGDLARKVIERLARDERVRGHVAAYDLNAPPPRKEIEGAKAAMSAVLNEVLDDAGLWEAAEEATPRGRRKMLETEFLQELSVEKAPGVAVLLTTQDTHSGELATEFLDWLNPRGLLGNRASPEALTVFRRKLRSYIKEHTICRRMEIHDLSAPVLSHIFQRNIEAAQRKLLHKRKDDELPQVRARFQNSWRIRLVVDDFNSFRTTYPDIHADPLLIPFLLFHLRREGISTLILDTQSGKPDISLAERFESSLREVADHRLYTWRIPFYGETRIAITAIPPLSQRNRGLIRELRKQWAGAGEDGADRDLTVDPHFELYAGLERGTPHPVPLEVRLYPGNEPVLKYLESENVFFKEIFTPVAGRSDVIVGFAPPKYEAFREFCYLQRDTRLDHTLVFQVDEFWLTWLTRQSKTRKAGILQRQWPYLNAMTVDRNGEPDRAADAYYLFQRPYAQTSPAGQTSPGPSAESRRLDFYDNRQLGYGFDDPSVEQLREVDRVPYAWDFAFLLCRENLWREYIHQKAERDAEADEKKKSKREMVGRVWSALPKAKTEPAESGASPAAGAAGGVNWRDFFESCKEVADYHSAKLSKPIPAFDFSLDDGEAFSCLVLSIWLSEVYATHARRADPQDRGKAARLARTLSQKVWEQRGADRVSLIDWLSPDRGRSLDDLLAARKNGEQTGYALELYKTWLLLTEVVTFDEVLAPPQDFSFEFKSRQSNPEAVAAHHFYQSACDLITQHGLTENVVAARLPGHFSVRGDWFLAAAGGSRSSRLAHRAMDLLCSRRANVKRMQLGLGLPVRKIVENEEDYQHMRTRLVSTDNETGRLKHVSYREFISIGGRTRTDPDDCGGEFYWLWRSSVYAYARYSRVWQKWLNRMARWWQTIQTRHRSAWTPGFEIYDQIEDCLREGGQLTVFHHESWKNFNDMVGILLVELNQVSFGRDPDESN